MPFITRIKNLLSASNNQGILGISMQQNSLAYCLVPEDESYKCDTLVVNDGDFINALTSLNQQEHVSGQTHLILSSKQNQLVQIEKPTVPEAEINSALKWQIKDLVNIPPEDMILDYFDGPKTAGGSEKINVVCASKTELKSYVEQLTEHELAIGSITIEEFAFTRLMPVKDDASLLVCQQPNEEMLLLIIKQGQLYFHRRLRGMAAIAQKSEDELTMGTIDSLSLEIQRSSDYFERQLKQAPIKTIEVLVPIKNEAFLARKLAENTNVPVNLFSLPETFATQRRFAACIGATMLANTEAK